MATSDAISAVSKGIVALLEGARSGAAAGIAGITVVPVRGADFANPPADGVTLFLHRVTPNQAQRNIHPAVGPHGKRRRPGLPLDLHYLLTPWGRSVESQQRILGWAMRALEDVPVLPSAFLNQHAGAPVFRPEEAVELICQPVAPAEMVSIWEVNKAQMQVAVPYVARMVTIDSTLEITTWPPVQTRQFEPGPRVDPPAGPGPGGGGGP